MLRNMNNWKKLCNIPKLRSLMEIELKRFWSKWIRKKKKHQKVDYKNYSRNMCNQLIFRADKMWDRYNHQLCRIYHHLASNKSTTRCATPLTTRCLLRCTRIGVSSMRSLPRQNTASSGRSGSSRSSSPGK